MAPESAKAAGNLLPNPSFEDGLNKNVVQGIDQPLLPMGWAFEGNAGLFDHSPHDRVSGKYSAAISIPAGGKRRVCYDQPVGCRDLTPVNDAKTAAATAYNVNPAWRPLLPVQLEARRSYAVSGWYTWQFATVTEGGVQVKVRWLDANRVPIRTDVVFTRIASTMRESDNLNWNFFSVPAHAPATARFAVPLFGTADDVWNSNFKFDDVGFSAV